jgi:hypothetical protein
MYIYIYRWQRRVQEAGEVAVEEAARQSVSLLQLDLSRYTIASTRQGAHPPIYPRVFDAFRATSHSTSLINQLTPYIQTHIASTDSTIICRHLQITVSNTSINYNHQTTIIKHKTTIIKHKNINRLITLQHLQHSFTDLSCTSSCQLQLHLL